jgi:hypothetical protein
MKRLNYYQVHKNKKPKKNISKKYSASKKMIKAYFNVVDNFSKKMNLVCESIKKQFEKGKVGGIICYLDSEGGMI